jgi:hypothetical protein
LVSIKVNHYAFIIDSDVVCIRPIPLNIINVINKGIITYYDISDQHSPAFGLKSLINDVNLINPNCDLGIWSGGEYFGANLSGLRYLDECVSEYIDSYFSCYNQLNQKSDENIYSLFVQNAITRGIPLVDVSNHFFLARFWSLKTLHIPESWSKVKSVTLLHLPSDKLFLNYYYKEFKTTYTPQHFINEYEKYIISECKYDLFYGLNIFKSKKESKFQLFKNKIKNILY